MKILLALQLLLKRVLRIKRRLSLIDGQIISNKKDNEKNELISFSLLDIDLTNLVTNTIKQPKLQETSTIKILNCLLMKGKENKFCNKIPKRKLCQIFQKNYTSILYTIYCFNLFFTFY